MKDEKHRYSLRFYVKSLNNKHCLHPSSFILCSSYPQPIRHPVNIIEIGGDEIYLQNCLIVKAVGSQGFHILLFHVGGRPRQFGGVIEHGPVSGG